MMAKKTLAEATRGCAFTFLDPDRNSSQGGHSFPVKWEASALLSQKQKKNREI